MACYNPPTIPTRFITLEELQERLGVTDEQLDRTIDAMQFLEIAHHIASTTTFEIAFDLDESEKHQIKMTRHSTCYLDGTLDMFDFWKKKAGGAATYRNLVVIVLEFEEDVRLASKIIEICKASTATTQSLIKMPSDVTGEVQDNCRIEFRVLDREDSKIIERKFSKLLSQFVHSLCERKITVWEVVVPLIPLKSITAIQSTAATHVLLFDVECLKTAKDIPSVFLSIGKYISFFEFQIIETLVEVLGNQLDKENLQAYKIDFEEYARKSIPIGAKMKHCASDNRSDRLCIRLDQSYYRITYVQLRNLRNKFAKILGINSDALTLESAEEGSIVLVFSISTAIKKWISQLITNHKILEELRQIGIRSIDYIDIQIGKVRRIIQLKWEVSRTHVPIDILSPTPAVVIGKSAFFRVCHSRQVYKYDLETDEWSMLGGKGCQHPDGCETKCPYCKCPTRDNTLVSIVDSLFTVGGLNIPRTEMNYRAIPAIPMEDLALGELYDIEEFSNKLYVRTQHGKWEESVFFPPMKVKRKQVIAICHGEYLIVAGGRTSEGPVKLVEVLNINTKQWFRASDLPKAVYFGSVCICDGYLYILGCHAMNANGEEEPIKSACRASLTELLNPDNLTQFYDLPPNVFKEICDLERKRSVCVSFCDRVLALGGTEQRSSSHEATSVRNIYQYNPPGDGAGLGSWQAVSDSMKIRRCSHFVAVFESGDTPKLMVVGGCPFRPDSYCITMIEYGEVKETAAEKETQQ